MKEMRGIVAEWIVKQDMGMPAYADSKALALISYLRRRGYAIVPVEPTEGMLNAARDWSYEKYGKPVGDDGTSGCWQAMLRAATEADR